MIKNVLVAADGSRYGDVATRTAAALTKRLGGRLDGLHVIDLWLLRGSFLHDVNGMLGIEPQLHMTEAVEGFLETKATSVVERLNARITEAGVPGSAWSVTGLVSDEVVQNAARHDLLVVGARGASLDGGQGLSGRHLPHQLLGDLPVPMLVTPGAAPALSHAVVAFDGSSGSFRALAVAAELAARADLRLSVLWVDSGGTEYEESDALALAERYLSGHGLKAAYEKEQGTARERVPAWAAANGADLVVCGCHGPSRIREFILGYLPAQLLEGELTTALLVCP